MKITIDRIIMGVLVIILAGTSIFFYLKAEHLEDVIDNELDYRSTNPEASGYISKEQALNIVLDNLNITQNDIYDLSIELDYKYNTTVYDIDFKYNRYEYDYYLDAKTGEIIKSFHEKD